MEWALSIFLISVIQGITEFLPISSSGHLVLLPHITGLADQGQIMDVAAHIGTFLAVAFYLRKEILQMLAALPSLFTSARHATHHLIIILLLASIPAICAGLAVEILSPDFLRFALTVAIANLVFAGWLWWADKQAVRHHLSDEEQTGWQQLKISDAIWIGIAQCCALIPGASRSGVTMTMARQLGYDRITSARFSLLLSLPIIAGAGAVKGAGLLSASAGADLSGLLAVIILSFIFALIAIRWMMGWLKTASFQIFIYYRFGLGLVLLALIATGVIA